MNTSWKDVKQQIKELIEEMQVSDIEIITRAGLNRATYYRLFDPKRAETPMRKSTVYAIAGEIHVKVIYLDGFPQFRKYKNNTEALYEEYFGDHGDIELSTTEMEEALARLAESIRSQSNAPDKTTGSLKSSNISDDGLLDLLSIDNIKKYRISKAEQSELSTISINHSSNGTLEQWVSILFALRTLDT